MLGKTSCFGKRLGTGESLIVSGWQDEFFFCKRSGTGELPHSHRQSVHQSRQLLKWTGLDQERIVLTTDICSDTVCVSIVECET